VHASSPPIFVSAIEHGSRRASETCPRPWAFDLARRIDPTPSPDGFMNPRHLPLALLLLAGCSDPECCAIKPPSFDVSVVDEEGCRWRAGA
jgi:hypothetical protein